jgi:hypothetical protein
MENEIYIFTKEQLAARDTLQKALCLAAAENKNDIEDSLMAITSAPSPEYPEAIHVPSNSELKEASYDATNKARQSMLGNAIDSFSWRLGAKYVMTILQPYKGKEYNLQNWCIKITEENRRDIVYYLGRYRNYPTWATIGKYYGVVDGVCQDSAHQPFSPIITEGQIKNLFLTLKE